MKSFAKFVQDFMPQAILTEGKYSPRGLNYFIDDSYYYGSYWFYQGQGFIIDIHDFAIKQDLVYKNLPDMSPYLFLISKYLISGSGEFIEPYQALEPNSMFIMDSLSPVKGYLLHGGSRYFMVGMMFSQELLDKTLSRTKQIRLNDLSKLFWESRGQVIKPLSKLADEILACQMEGVSADLFFEAKAREWLSISLDAYEHSEAKPRLKEADQRAIANVANYINDHYALDIPQAFLEKIGAMSKTKLKSSFKSAYGMTITEYTQRKRMNMAENLLLSTDLEIRAIAKSVGYNSASRFSSLFKRYKGIYPSDLRKGN